MALLTLGSGGLALTRRSSWPVPLASLPPGCCGGPSSTAASISSDPQTVTGEANSWLPALDCVQDREAAVGEQPYGSGRATGANADSVNHWGAARRSAWGPWILSAPERRAWAQLRSPRQTSVMRRRLAVTATATG